MGTSLNKLGIHSQTSRCGCHEYQTLGPGSVAYESAKAYDQCKKHKGHKSFIPIQKLTVNHLPSEIRGDEEVVQFISIVADLTVRLRVNETSSNRPEKGCYCLDDESRIRSGTGYIWHASSNPTSCRCCTHGDKPEGSHNSWRIYVATAMHTVFDNDEAKMTFVDFFYDDETGGGRIKTVREGGKMVYTHEKTDWCKLEFTTCDAELGPLLVKLTNQRVRLGESLLERYCSEKSINIAWIVSHPHGRAKCVTFGKMKKGECLGDHDFKYSYTVPTCGGTSGAAVWQLKYRRENSWIMLLFDAQNGYQTVLDGGRDEGPTVLARKACSHHPGHKRFTPVDTMTRKQLPWGYRNDKNLFKFMKVVADLTVRLEVSYSGVEGFSEANGRDTRFGTGYIWGVWPNVEPCQSEGRGKSWRVKIYTAKSLVFSDSIAGATRADLFYNGEESLIDGRMKTAVGGRVEDYDDETRWCRLEFTISDGKLVEKLEGLISRREKLGKTLVEHYWSDRSHDMVWAVSHPHGRAKHVTFGKIKKKEGMGRDNRPHLYDLDTCPGCNGAAVWKLSPLGGSAYDTVAPTAFHSDDGGSLGYNIGHY